MKILRAMHRACPLCSGVTIGFFLPWIFLAAFGSTGFFAACIGGLIAALIIALKN